MNRVNVSEKPDTAKFLHWLEFRHDWNRDQPTQSLGLNWKTFSPPYGPQMFVRIPKDRATVIVFLCCQLKANIRNKNGF